MTPCRIRQLIWLAAGTVALLAGLIGIFLPLIPTTPFLVLAAFCYSRSSEQLHSRLLANRRVGRAIRDWHAYGAISRSAKRLALLSMAFALSLSMLAGVPLVAITVQATAMLAAAAFIVTRPAPPARQADEQER
ncbi:YbaN family protein [Aminobacter sp. HY435]|uniref:YbaN family protein n=1 Tax=Aminobacter sp. HY435 TaxID=2970917 RepID=UPI0022B99F9E|nr:YbaN family protein [Aminobacter sp. HY435]